MDKRILRTRRILGQTLINLLQEQALHQISIRQLTDQAGVAYSTFFRNFESIDDLLLANLTDLLAELKQVSIEVQGYTMRDYSYENVKFFFTHVQNNRTLYQTLLNTAATYPIVKTFQRTLVEDNLAMLNPFQDNLLTDTPPELIVYNSIGQLFSTIEWWIANDLEPDVDTISRYYEQLVTLPMWNLLFGADQARHLLNQARE